jgi:hypothetical protein
MNLKNIIKHHRYEAEHSRRLRALVAYDFHIKAAAALEEIERRFREAITEGET